MRVTKNVLLSFSCLTALFVAILALTAYISRAAKQQATRTNQTTISPISELSQSRSMSKHVEIQNLLDSCSRIALIAEAHAKRNKSSGGIDSEAKEAINRELKRFNSVDEIFMLAIMTKAITGDGDAADAPYDNVFFEAYHSCISLLAETPNNAAAMALVKIKARTGADAGESLILDEAIKTQESKQKSKRSLR
jgi:hypothetical protein